MMSRSTLYDKIYAEYQAKRPGKPFHHRQIKNVEKGKFHLPFVIPSRKPEKQK